MLIVSYFIWIYYFEKYDFYGFLIYGNFGSKIGIDVGGFVVIVDSWNFNLDLVCEKVCIDYLKKIILWVNIVEI